MIGEFSPGVTEQILYTNSVVAALSSQVKTAFKTCIPCDKAGISKEIYPVVAVIPVFLNSGFNSGDGSYIRDESGNLDVYSHGELELLSQNNILIHPMMDSYKTVVASGNTDNKALGIVLDDSGETITMGTLSDYLTVDKTKPYIEITKTAVNIKGLNQIT